MGRVLDLESLRGVVRFLYVILLSSRNLRDRWINLERDVFTIENVTLPWVAGRGVKISMSPVPPYLRGWAREAGSFVACDKRTNKESVPNEFPTNDILELK